VFCRAIVHNNNKTVLVDVESVGWTCMHNVLWWWRHKI